LAEQPLNDYQPMHPEFPDEDIMTLFEEKLDKDKDKWRWGGVGLSEQSMHTFHGQNWFRLYQQHGWIRSVRPWYPGNN